MPNKKLNVLEKQPSLLVTKSKQEDPCSEHELWMNDIAMIDWKHIKVNENFTYVYTNVTPAGDCDQEFNTTNSKATQPITMLRPVWRATIFSVNTKIKIFRNNMMSVLLYVSECWKPTVAP